MKMPVWLKPGCWGFVFGIVFIWIVGFSVFGWTMGSTTANMAKEQVSQAVTQALVPVCLAQANADPAKAKKLEEFKKVESYEQSDFVAKSGWATMPGAKEPNSDVANVCASRLADAK